MTKLKFKASNIKKDKMITWDNEIHAKKIKGYLLGFYYLVV